jgi:uncharacterized protein (DUF608 family)
MNAFVYGKENAEEFDNEEVKALLASENISLKGTEFRRQKLIKKAYLITLAGDALNASSYMTLHKESDDSFGDPLLADTYLEMMSLPTVSTLVERTSVAKKAYQTNFKLNSPHCGYANLVTHDGQPKEAFQAQDVWIGVQHSNAASLLLLNEKESFHNLMDSMTENLYVKAKIPFAAPEGFNCSCTLDEHILEPLLGSKTKEFITELTELEWLMKDGRVSAQFPVEETVFTQKMNHFLEAMDAIHIFRTIQTTGLKYTAGRYFRPGMIFSLPILMEQR